jgi:S1-C subfamily serine protease
VEDVAPAGFAAAAGFQPGDVILSIDDEEPPDLEAAVAALQRERDTPAAVRVRRGQRTLVLRLERATDRR